AQEGRTRVCGPIISRSGPRQRCEGFLQLRVARTRELAYHDAVLQEDHARPQPDPERPAQRPARPVLDLQVADLRVLAQPRRHARRGGAAEPAPTGPELEEHEAGGTVDLLAGRRFFRRQVIRAHRAAACRFAPTRGEVNECRPEPMTKASGAFRPGIRTSAEVFGGSSRSSEKVAPSHRQATDTCPRGDSCAARAQVIPGTGWGRIRTRLKPGNAGSGAMPARSPSSHSMICPSMKWFCEDRGFASQASVRDVAPRA